jgi:hypothetical protein
VFKAPAVWFGADPMILCPFVPRTTAPPTEDGLWLEPGRSLPPLSSQLTTGNLATGFYPQRLITHGTTQILISPTSGDNVFVQIDAAGQWIAGDIGLGVNPATAEAALSSITPVPNG